MNTQEKLKAIGLPVPVLLEWKAGRTAEQNSRFSAESGIFWKITYLQFIHKLSKATL